MKELVHSDAFMLFTRWVDARCGELTRKAIKYAHGVPLALNVLGLFLTGRIIEE